MATQSTKSQRFKTEVDFSIASRNRPSQTRQPRSTALRASPERRPLVGSLSLARSVAPSAACSWLAGRHGISTAKESSAVAAGWKKRPTVWRFAEVTPQSRAATRSPARFCYPGSATCPASSNSNRSLSRQAIASKNSVRNTTQISTASPTPVAMTISHHCFEWVVHFDRDTAVRGGSVAFGLARMEHRARLAWPAIDCCPEMRASTGRDRRDIPVPGHSSPTGTHPDRPIGLAEHLSMARVVERIADFLSDCPTTGGDGSDIEYKR